MFMQPLIPIILLHEVSWLQLNVKLVLFYLTKRFLNNHTLWYPFILFSIVIQSMISHWRKSGVASNHSTLSKSWKRVKLKFMLYVLPCPRQNMFASFIYLKMHTVKLVKLFEVIVVVQIHSINDVNMWRQRGVSRYKDTLILLS